MPTAISINVTNDPSTSIVGSNVSKIFNTNLIEDVVRSVAMNGVVRTEFSSDLVKNDLARYKQISQPTYNWSENPKSLEEHLYDASSEAKIAASTVATYLDNEWRKKLFRQIDSIHDLESWQEGDIPLRRSSFESFLKVICRIKPNRKPGLGLSSQGFLIAMWAKDSDRLTIDFLAKGRVRWVITQTINGIVEHIAGDTDITRLEENLDKYNSKKWFS